ncbi:MAG: GGDEF domain-containing protein [Lachnospiraceae bacterium]|nr:GGDEF domain-containing protein [Lachnospiraceae bacterium]
MSRHVREKDKTLTPVLILGTVVLAVCILICVSYVIDLRKRYIQDTENNFRQHMDMAGLVIEQSFDQMLQNTTAAANRLEQLEKESTDVDRIQRILLEYRNVNNLDEMIYVKKNGMTYFYEEQPYFAMSEKQLDAIIVDQTIITISNDNVVDDTNGIVVVSAPVHDGDGTQIGSVVSVKTLNGILQNHSFAYLRDSGQMFLIGKEGYVYDLAVTQERQIKSKETNFFVRLRSMSKGSTANKQRIQTLKNKTLASNVVTGKLKGADGADLYVIVDKIDTDMSLYLAECYSEEVFAGRLTPIVNRSILVCVLIFILMALVIAFMWNHMKRTSDTIRKLAYMDSITKGKNFNYFLEKAILIIKDNQEIPYLVQRFDISNFRYINEAYGHIKADELLTVIIMEGEKVFGSKELIVRMNADQFVLLVQNSADYLNRFAIFEDNVNMRALELGIKFPIRLKSGIYQVRRDDYDINVMVDRANVARKSLSAKSKEMYAYYSDRIINDMRKIEKIESEQQTALINGEFKVYLQPKWDINKDKLYGAEALVRWIKDDGNMVYPDTFIPVFENNGFIEQLDFYMLDQVCAEIRKLLDEGKPAFPISVNQSRRLWDNPEYVENVERILRKYDIPSHYVDLEVTETVFFGERDKMIEIITQLKQKEVLLSMDDFGSGYSSLNLLKDIPFDILKIDKDFFSESITSNSSILILTKIIEMAEGLGIHVLCEGVETKEQVHLLRDIGCQYVQGYFYSKPIPLNDFIQKYVS